MLEREFYMHTKVKVGYQYDADTLFGGTCCSEHDLPEPTWLPDTLAVAKLFRIENERVGCQSPCAVLLDTGMFWLPDREDWASSRTGVDWPSGLFKPVYSH